jgi:branched-chain amino acid transport system substrate-binding protein
MLYRENGQFKTSYAADQQIFPIAQDRWAMLGLLLFAFVGVPLLVDEYLFRAILIPFLILSLAALGVNILVGFCGQITLGAGAFMAVGAYAAYNFHIRIAGMPLLGSFLLGGFTAAVVGIFFGIPSLRVRGLYLAVATLAAQFFTDWVFLRVPWFTNNASSGSVSVSNLQIMHWQIVTPVDKYLFCLSFVTVFALLAKNMTRCAVGRQWMAIRDMDVAAEVIGIRPLFAKLSAFAVSSFFVGTAGALWGFIHLSSWEPAAFSVDRSFQLLFMVIIGGLGIDHGQLLRCGLHRHPADRPESVPAGPRKRVRDQHLHGRRFTRRTDHFWRTDHLLSDQGATWPCAPVVDRQGKTAALALSALSGAPELGFAAIRGFRAATALRLQQEETLMKLRKLALTASAAAVVLSSLFTAPAALAQAKEQFFPVLVYRTGAYATNGAQWANGYVDYLKLVNARGGINGVKISFEECETAYATDRGVECYERLKGKNGGATVFQPLSTGVTFALTEKAPVDKIPLITAGYGRSESQNGAVFTWNFPLLGTYWVGAEVAIQHIAKKEGGVAKLKGKKIALVYHDSPYGKEPIPVLQELGKTYGFEVQLLPVAHPGVEQKATWLQIRQQKPDYVLLWGWGVMNSTALREAQSTGYPRDRMLGVWWAGAEPDVKDVAEGAKGYSALTLQHGAEPNSRVVKDMLELVYAKGQGTGPKGEVGQVLYMRGLLSAMLGVEGVRKAQERYGKGKVMTGEQVRWGLENLNLDQKTLDSMGFAGVMRPVQTSCLDHMGSSWVRIHTWNGSKWEFSSDWYQADEKVIRPMVMLASSKYAEEKKLKPRTPEECRQ